MPEDRLTLLLGTVPASIRRKAHAAARKSSGNLNDEIVGVLSKHYGIDFTPTGSPTPAGSFKPGDRKMLLRVSDALDHAILQDAVDKRLNKTTLVCSLLADHYGVKYTPLSARRSPVGGGRQAAAA